MAQINWIDAVNLFGKTIFTREGDPRVYEMAPPPSR